jgi:hypothetical protein
MASILTKAAFAAKLGVSRSRISQWISAKQIYGAALVGEGRGARIRVATACAQLKKTLDISQSLANGRAKLNAPGTAADATSTSDVTVEEQIKAERLLQLELMNQKAREDRAARTGRYVLAADARQQMGQISSRMLSAVEGWHGELASIISGKFNLPQRDVAHLVRTEFRGFRSRAAAALRREAEQVPVLVEDPVVAGDEATPPSDDGATPGTK